MYARALGGGEVIDAPPTHLQENEGNDEHPEGQPIAMARELTVMYIYKVCKPGDGGPRLLGVPRPECTAEPPLLCTFRTANYR